MHNNGGYGSVNCLDPNRQRASRPGVVRVCNLPDKAESLPSPVKTSTTMFRQSRLLVPTMILVAFSAGGSLDAATIVKANNTTSLDDPNSWVGGVVPTERRRMGLDRDRQQRGDADQRDQRRFRIRRDLHPKSGWPRDDQQWPRQPGKQPGPSESQRHRHRHVQRHSGPDAQLHVHQPGKFSGVERWIGPYADVEWCCQRRRRLLNEVWRRHAPSERQQLVVRRRLPLYDGRGRHAQVGQRLFIRHTP